MEKTTIVGNGCGVLGIWSITVHPSHIVPGQQQMHFPIQFLFRGFGANFVTLLTTQLQILLHFGVNTSKTCLPVQLYKPNPKIAVLNFLTLKTKPASSSIIKEEEKEGEDVQSNEDEKDEKEEELQSNVEEKEEEELQSNDKEEEEGEL